MAEEEARYVVLHADVLAVDVAEAARRLGISERTVWTRVTTAELPSYREGDRVLIAVRDLEAYVASRPRQRPRPQKVAG